jgi:hypothetical protein
MENQDLIMTVKPGDREGGWIPKVLYEKLAHLILKVLDSNNEVTTSQLLQEVTQSLSGKSAEDIGWRIYLVKLDLEAREIITSKRVPGRPKKVVITRTRKILKQRQPPLLRFSRKKMATQSSWI